MDEVLAKDIQDRWEYEAGRTAPPEGFPRFPDLPLARYTDQGLYEAEIEAVFKRRWLFAGHLSEYPRTGSYRVLDVPFAPVVLVRGKDDMVRAFMNSCRHRGAPVVRDECGTSALLVCQFHSWTYDLTGKLLRTPGGERDFIGFDCAERELAAVRCETWGDFLFINLDRDAAPLLEYVAPLTRRYDQFMNAPLVYLGTTPYHVNCNWKIAVEAFLETYHLKTVHPRTAAPVFDSSRTVMQLHPNGHSTMSSPYVPEMLAEGEDGELEWSAAVPMISGLSEFFHVGHTHPMAFPNSIVSCDVKGFPVITMWPLDIDHTRMDVAWYGVDWGDGPRPEGWEARLAGLDVLMMEDVANMNPIQKSIRAAAHKGVPLSYQERRS